MQLFPDFSSITLRANICPFSRSVLIGFQPVAADSFSHRPRRKSRLKPDGDTD